MGCEGMFFVPKEKKKNKEKEMIIMKSSDKNYFFHSVSKGQCKFQFGACCFLSFYVVTVSLKQNMITLLDRRERPREPLTKTSFYQSTKSNRSVVVVLEVILVISFWGT